jgi:catechol 2,3-dioxygenase-like lactoylglutathione lyase family enzyme
MGTSITGFETITLQVSDLGRSLLFYTNFLGIEFPERSQKSASAVVGGVRLLLHEDFDPTLKGGRRGAGVGIHFSVRDVDALHRDLQKRGLMVDLPESHPWGREFSVKDPDGYEIEFISPAK